jgi:hypothetical protein
MQRENMRDIARRLIANYSLKRGGSPCHLEPLAEHFAQGAELANQVANKAQPTMLEKLSDDRALWFDITLTDADARFLESLRIDPNG